MATSTPQNPVAAERTRLSIELSPIVSAHLEHVSEVMGATKSAIVCAAFLDALPDLLARADGLKKRYSELNQSNQVKRK